jgi:hypothetical protein
MKSNTNRLLLVVSSAVLIVLLVTGCKPRREQSSPQSLPEVTQALDCHDVYKGCRVAASQCAEVCKSSFKARTNARVCQQDPSNEDGHLVACYCHDPASAACSGGEAPPADQFASVGCKSSIAECSSACGNKGPGIPHKNPAECPTDQGETQRVVCYCPR